MNVNERQGDCMFSLVQNYNNWNIHEIETTDPLLFCLQNPTKFTYIFLLSIYNHELLWRRWTPCHQTNGWSLFERYGDELIIDMEMSTFFSGVSLYAVGDSGKF